MKKKKYSYRSLSRTKLFLLFVVVSFEFVHCICVHSGLFARQELFPYSADKVFVTENRFLDRLKLQQGLTPSLNRNRFHYLVDKSNKNAAVDQGHFPDENIFVISILDYFATTFMKNFPLWNRVFKKKEKDFLIFHLIGTFM